MELSIREQVKNILADGEKLVDEIVVQLQTGKEDKGIANFMILIESLSAVIAVLQDNKENMISNFDALNIQGFNDVMKEIMGAWEHMDVVLVADLLEYELKGYMHTIAENI